MTALARVADTVASVWRESRIWAHHLIGEGHATVRRQRKAASAQVAALDSSEPHSAARS